MTFTSHFFRTGADVAAAGAGAEDGGGAGGRHAGCGGAGVGAGAGGSTGAGAGSSSPPPKRPVSVREAARHLNATVGVGRRDHCERAGQKPRLTQNRGARLRDVFGVLVLGTERKRDTHHTNRQCVRCLGVHQRSRIGSVG